MGTLPVTSESEGKGVPPPPATSGGPRDTTWLTTQCGDRPGGPQPLAAHRRGLRSARVPGRAGPACRTDRGPENH